MTPEEFVEKRRFLFWSVKEPTKLSEAAILEATLNYGDMPDVRELLAIVGIGKASEIFQRQIRGKRHNYRPEIKQYFQRYFAKYA